MGSAFRIRVFRDHFSITLVIYTDISQIIFMLSKAVGLKHSLFTRFGQPLGEAYLSTYVSWRKNACVRL